MWDMTHWYVRQNSCTWETWLIHKWVMTHLYRHVKRVVHSWNDSCFIYESVMFRITFHIWMSHISANGYMCAYRYAHRDVGQISFDESCLRHEWVMSQHVNRYVHTDMRIETYTSLGSMSFNELCLKHGWIISRHVHKYVHIYVHI